MIWDRTLVWWLWVLALYLLCLIVAFRWGGAIHGGGSSGPYLGSD